MAENIRRVRPTLSNAYLGNPHKGCCTFQHFNGDPLFPGTSWSEEGPTEFPVREPKVVDGYLPTTVSYCRWFWRLIEPEKGKFDFTVIEKSLETAKARGQSMALRIMPFGSVGQPPLPQWYLDRHPTEREGDDKRFFLHPKYDSLEYLEHFGGLMREFGRRYDGHPLVESVDIGYVGPWGEGAGVASQKRHHEFHELCREAWPRTPRLCEISDEQMIAGMAAGTGWRINCFGDLGNHGSEYVSKHVSWNHHYDCYPRAISLFQAGDAWKKNPVHLETGWVPMGWYQKGWDIDFILEQGLKYHPTYFMPKYSRLPEAWMDKLATFCKKIGYRFVLRHVMFDVQAARGGTFRFQCWVDNVGTAPIYRPYRFALRLRQGDNAFVIPIDDVDVRTWLPGDTWVDREIRVPAGLQPGYAELSAGLIDAETRQVKVKFAVKEQFSDGWVPLDGIVLK